MESESDEQAEHSVPMFPWDKSIVHPQHAKEHAAYVASCMCVGVGYAESRFVKPYIAYDLIEWQ